MVCNIGGKKIYLLPFFLLTCLLTVFSTAPCFNHTNDSVANITTLRSGLRQNYYLLLVMALVMMVVKLMMLVVI